MTDHEINRALAEAHGKAAYTGLGFPRSYTTSRDATAELAESRGFYLECEIDGDTGDWNAYLHRRSDNWIEHHATDASEPRARALALLEALKAGGQG